MRVIQLKLKNYRSFPADTDTVVHFHTSYSILVGKNNAGKSNLISIFDLLLGAANPKYHCLKEEDYFDTSQPIEIEMLIGDIAEAQKEYCIGLIRSLNYKEGPTNKRIGIFLNSLAKRGASIALTFHAPPYANQVPPPMDESELAAELQSAEEGTDEGSDVETDSQNLELYLFEVAVKAGSKIEKIRKQIVRIVTVEAIRDAEKELEASKWTRFGQLMKSVLEDSPEYPTIVGLLRQLNAAIQEAFDTQKQELLNGARVISYVDDIHFQLTKEGHPSELLRNLEVLVTDGQKKLPITNMGTGTQSAVVLGMLELALKRKGTNFRVFCIEDPEAFIHPAGIRFLSSRLRQIASDSPTTQVLISTHSTHIVSAFSPAEIIVVRKENGYSVVSQVQLLDDSWSPLLRFINQASAEMFLADRVVLLEGDTEKIILSGLCSQTPEVDGQPLRCDFDRNNTALICLDSKDAVLNYVKILTEFGIPFLALLDSDFKTCPTFAKACRFFRINPIDASAVTLLRKRGLFTKTQGEFEDLLPDTEISRITGKTLQEITQIKGACAKTSDAFSKIFATTRKPIYARMITDFYSSNLTHPFVSIIRALNSFDNERIATAFGAL